MGEKECTCKEGKINVFSLLHGDYAGRVAVILENKKEAEARLEALRDYSKDDILSAKIKILSREIDEHTAVGDIGGSDALKDERANVQSELVTKQEERAKAIEAVKAEIEGYETAIKRSSRACAETPLSQYQGYGASSAWRMHLI